MGKQGRDNWPAELKGLRKDLGSYVQSISNGDQALITSAGFAIEKSGQPMGQLPAPGNVRVVVRPFPGSLELRFAGVKGRFSYGVQMCGGRPGWRRTAARHPQARPACGGGEPESSQGALLLSA
ncbi:MAG: hypothetical protein IPM46_14350 [Flavobacteriales bacterium]|nr:hypothetical protein [Flavobacteriales bacterium]